jgi:hypothetical protein
MRSDDLTRDQARALKNKLQPMLGYLNRLKKRMQRRGFPPDDRLLIAACRAEEALHALSVEVHYVACGDTAGRAASEVRAASKQSAGIARRRKPPTH